mmetsp:Transcript_11534/g.23506  ORF Transcript_11534/g.23506 Transcript_11534/m.23506 type:complete len:118 (+) Transcript_11534:49-402(+)
MWVFAVLSSLGRFGYHALQYQLVNLGFLESISMKNVSSFLSLDFCFSIAGHFFSRHRVTHAFTTDTLAALFAWKENLQGWESDLRHCLVERIFVATNLPIEHLRPRIGQRMVWCAGD